jgi:hypothetical protein
MRYARFIIRILATLSFAAIGFFVGLYLPLYTYMLFHGDPGMPGGAGLVIIGFPLGVIGAVIAGTVSLVKLHPWREFSK